MRGRAYIFIESSGKFEGSLSLWCGEGADEG